MNRRLSIKNPAIFAIISFVAIIGVSFMLVFSAVASSNNAAAPADETSAVVSETDTVEEAAQAAAAPIEMKAVQETEPAEIPAKDTPAPVVEDEYSDYEVFEDEPEESDFEEYADYSEEEEPVEAEEEEPVKAEEEEPVEAEEDPEVVLFEDDSVDLGGMVALINEDQINFRSVPDSSDDSNIIYVLYAGSAHSAISSEGDWTLIYVEGFGEGYVYSNFVSLQEDGDISSYESVVAAANGAAAAGNDHHGHMEYEEEDDDYEEEPESYAYAYINEDEINFRSSPDTGSSDNIICALAYGTTHYYLGSEGGWIIIEADGYGEGYVSSAYVTLTNEGEITPYEYVAVTADSYDEEDDSYGEEDYEEVYEDYSDPYASLRQEIVDYACTFAGWLPYVWGSHSLSYGADCSGFTSAIYGTFGYSLSCDSEVQSRQGYSVPVSEILPGDIIVYSGHVAMYVGDGLKIHSPYPGTVVTIDSMYYTTILDVRRIIG